MGKISSEVKTHIQRLSKADLEEIVLRFASKNKELLNYITVKYIDPDFGEHDLFEETKKDIQLLFMKSYKGFSQQLQLANMLEACIKRINEFQKICKKKNLEADLLIMVLNEVFSYPYNFFGTCFTKYDSKTGIILRRLINLVNTKLHPDYKIEYRNKVNEYLARLHRTSNHIDLIYSLPEEI